LALSGPLAITKIICFSVKHFVADYFNRKFFATSLWQIFLWQKKLPQKNCHRILQVMPFTG